MDKEIKFRGQRVDNSKWIYGSYLYLNTRDHDWTGKEVGKKQEVHFIVDEEDMNIAVKPETVGQYIGLNDRVNQKKIYNKDIVKALNRAYDCEDNWKDYFQTFEVTYLNGCWMFGNYNAHEFFNKYMHIEVFGNSIDNPNLIK